MRDCPKCSAKVDGSVCHNCGYAEPGARSGKPQPVRDPDWWRCAWNDHGIRCDKAGGFSHSTTGGGPWYCTEHSRPQRAQGGRVEVPEGVFQRARRALIARQPGEDDE